MRATPETGLRHMTVLEYALETLRVDGVVQRRVTLAGNWAFEVRPDAGYATFYIVKSGFAWIATSRGAHQRLRPGTAALVRAGTPHVVTRKPRLSPVEARSFFSNCESTEPLHLRSGRGRTETDLIAGFCYFGQHAVDPLLASLPALIVLDASDSRGGASEAWEAT